MKIQIEFDDLAEVAKREEEGGRKSPYIGVMVMLLAWHREGLLDGAVRLREIRGGTGRADMSQIVRALIEDWMAAGAPIPKRLLPEGQ